MNRESAGKSAFSFFANRSGSGVIYASPSGFINETTIGGYVEETIGLSYAQFAIYFIDRLPWLVKHQEMNAAVDDVAFAFPANCSATVRASRLFSYDFDGMGVITKRAFDTGKMKLLHKL
jgi:hypothetical protein